MAHSRSTEAAEAAAEEAGEAGEAATTTREVALASASHVWNLLPIMGMQYLALQTVLSAGKEAIQALGEQVEEMTQKISQMMQGLNQDMPEEILAAQVAMKTAEWKMEELKRFVGSHCTWSEGVMNAAQAVVRYVLVNRPITFEEAAVAAEQAEKAKRFTESVYITLQNVLESAHVSAAYAVRVAKCAVATAELAVPKVTKAAKSVQAAAQAITPRPPTTLTNNASIRASLLGARVFPATGSIFDTPPVKITELAAPKVTKVVAQAAQTAAQVVRQAAASRPVISTDNISIVAGLVGLSAQAKGSVVRAPTAFSTFAVVSPAAIPTEEPAPKRANTVPVVAPPPPFPLRQVTEVVFIPPTPLRQVVGPRS